LIITPISTELIINRELTDRGCDTENKGTRLQSDMCGIIKYRQKYVNLFRFVD